MKTLKFSFKKFALYSIFLLLALFLTFKIMPTKIIVSKTYQGPPIEQMSNYNYNLVACIEAKQCIHQGGFPFGYLVDLDGTSVLGSLGPEDQIIWYKFLGNVLFYFLILALLKTIIEKLLRKKKV